MTAEDLIRIMCPNLSCQRILAVPEAARGKIVRCRVCGMNVRIPEGKSAQPATPQPADQKEEEAGRAKDRKSA